MNSKTTPRRGKSTLPRFVRILSSAAAWAVILAAVVFGAAGVGLIGVALAAMWYCFSDIIKTTVVILGAFGFWIFAVPWAWARIRNANKENRGVCPEEKQ